MFKKVLIANRSEIAVRVIRTCKRLGIKTVAVFSEPDRDALHTQLADEAYCIGPASSALSYLNIPNLLSVAHATKCEAIHPGYGFLSENSNFADLTDKCGFVFIGPSQQVIQRMGQKSYAREVMAKHGIPIMPGTLGDVVDIDDARARAAEIGFPLLIKATAGGGGRGMRLVNVPAELEPMYLTATAEAKAAFGDGRVYLERYLEDPRHIEVQILADHHGNVFALGERECSIQRRHQKLIEESPSPALTPSVRAELLETAERAARVAEYTNAGTIEFLLDARGNFYFMEMNTRLQVEHPVTEMVTGIDLVEQQLLVAAGEKISIKPASELNRGWAIECRINAESIDDNFRPSPGLLTQFRVPGGPWVRVDTAAFQGYRVSPHYDSLIGKLITWAPTRVEAIHRMAVALDEFRVEGVETTIPFHALVMRHPAFLAGEFSTRFIETHLSQLLAEVKRDRPGEKTAVA
jgi:acetyl-CoA carboxylase biotin carboxylase subunit